MKPGAEVEGASLGAGAGGAIAGLDAFIDADLVARFAPSHDFDGN